MTTQATAEKQAAACARIYGGTWYLSATPFGWERTTDYRKATEEGTLVAMFFGEVR
jgi:hypothetical protein